MKMLKGFMGMIKVNQNTAFFKFTSTTKENVKKENVTKTSKRESEYILSKIKTGILLNIFVVIVCTIFDFFMLLPPFRTGNMDNADLLCVLFALTLDAIPALVGVLFAKRKDSDTELILKREDGNESTEKEEKDLKTWTFFLWLLVIVTVLAFLFYFAARAILIIGGDDFDIGFRIVKSWLSNKAANVDMSTINYNFSAVSIMTPLLSSVFALVASIVVSKSKFDFSNKLYKKIGKTIEDCISNCETELTDLNSKRSSLDEKSEQMKAELWADYFQSKSIPEPEEFAMQIQRSERIRNTEKYKGEYYAFCRQARCATESAMLRLTEKLSPYSDDPRKIIDMTITNDEKEDLRYIWNFDINDQHEQTIMHEEEIENYIENMVEQWSSKEPTSGVDDGKWLDDSINDSNNWPSED